MTQFINLMELKRKDEPRCYEFTFEFKFIVRQISRYFKVRLFF